MDDIMFRLIESEQLERIAEVKKSKSLSNNMEESTPDAKNFKEEFVKAKLLEYEEKERQKQ